MNVNPLRRIVTLILRRPTWHPTQIIQERRLIYQIRQLSLTVQKLQNKEQKEHDESEDSTKKKKRLQVSVDESIRYMDSEEFKQSYKNDVIWTHYRRNFKGPAKLTTRETCVRGQYTTTGSPCPVCRDEYLVVDYRNVKLIEHFTDPVTGELYDTKRTGVCQKQQRKLQLEKFKAMEYGYMEGNVPFLFYNYKHLDKEFGIIDEEKEKANVSNYAKWRSERAHAREKAETEKTTEATNK